MIQNIAAVVVTYNRKALLKKCIDHILKQSAGAPDILVIDNASTDGTEGFITEEYGDVPEVKYYNTGANLGGAGGFSYGINKAVCLDYEYLWIMDDDTIPEKDALSELIKADKLLDGNYGFLSSYAKWIDGTPCQMNVPAISYKWRENINLIDEKMIRLDSASFVSMYIKASIVKEVGLPIKEFFIWADDVEYSLRISEKHPCYFVYGSQVVHEMGSNKATAIWETDMDRIDRYKCLYRNRYYIARRKSKREVFNFWINIKNTIKDIKKSGCSDKRKRIKIVRKSALSGLKFKPSIEYPGEKENGR